MFICWQNCAFSPSNHHSLGSNTIPTYIQFYGEIDTKRNKIRTKRGQKKDEKEEKMGRKKGNYKGKKKKR